MTGNVYKFVTTRVIHHGPGALERLGAEVSRFGARRVGIITDPGVAAAGLVDRVCATFPVDAGVLAEVEPEPPYPLVERCVAFLKDTGAELVIGVGGGSSMDTAKMAALMAGNTGSVADYFGADRVPRPGLPSIAIPTTAGTGSEVSPAAVFVDPADGAKKGVRSDFMLPEVAILDPTLTVGLPPALTASTGIDALTHSIEAYTSPRATVLSDMVAEQSIRLVGRHLRAAYGDGSDLEARDGMLMGSMLGGMALAIANVGAVHALAHVLGGSYKVRHGVANALLLPHLMAFNRPACVERHARIAALLGEDVEGLSPEEASLRATEAVCRLTRDVNIPQHLGELGVPEEALDRVAEGCMATQGRLLATNARAMSLEDARAILRAAY
jgi:alcohol dehydrogenase